MAYEIQTAAAKYETIARFRDYAEAQAVVDTLSDREFDVSTVKIVGEGLRSEEYVTGRLTKGRAALAGLGSGAWLGLFIGILFGLFAPAFGWLSIILWSVVIGAVWGAIFGFVAHLATGGKRDFKSVRTTAADTYLVQVQAERAHEAITVLNR
ncbi:general stress protein [Kocuria marina]|uniref:general stress protein n=1 Tax=Kocuria marina TaxID=223184 RepID=UPI00068B48DC|nr:general stress protein [Kocuria marina]